MYFGWIFTNEQSNQNLTMSNVCRQTKQLIEQISKYKQIYPKESSIADNFIKFVEENPEKCYYRELISGHLTYWLMTSGKFSQIPA